MKTWSFSGFHLEREELNEPSISYFMHLEIWNAPSSQIIHIGMQQNLDVAFVAMLALSSDSWVLVMEKQQDIRNQVTMSC